MTFTAISGLTRIVLFLFDTVIIMAANPQPFFSAAFSLFLL